MVGMERDGKMGRIALGILGWMLFAYAILAQPQSAPVAPALTHDFGEVQVAGVWLRSVAVQDADVERHKIHIEGPDQAAFRILSTSGEGRTVVHLGFEPAAARVHQATLMIGGERPVAIPLRGVGLVDSPDKVIWPSI